MLILLRAVLLKGCKKVHKFIDIQAGFNDSFKTFLDFLLKVILVVNDILLNQANDIDTANLKLNKRPK